MNFRREDNKKVREIMDIREKLAKNRQLKWNQILFAQIKMTHATHREHARATFPLYQQEGLKYWRQLVRLFNLKGDPKKAIISVKTPMKTIQGKIRNFWLLELAYKGTAAIAKKHQDILNKGGINKSDKLAIIEKDRKLKEKHARELAEIIRLSKKRGSGIY